MGVVSLVFMVCNAALGTRLVRVGPMTLRDSVNYLDLCHGSTFLDGTYVFMHFEYMYQCVK